MASPRFRHQQTGQDAARPDSPAAAEGRHAPRLRLIAPTDGSSSTTEDAALLAALGDGQPAALATLYNRYADHVFTVLVRVVGEREAAEELLQEVFLTVWQQAVLFDPTRGTVACWLRGIAHNLALSELRRRRRRPQIIPGRDVEREDDELAGCVDPTPEPDAAAWRAARDAALARAVDRLPPAQRAVIALYAAGFSQSEIAAQLDEPLGTVKSRMRLGLARLRAALPTLGIDADAASD